MQVWLFAQSVKSQDNSSTQKPHKHTEYTQHCVRQYTHLELYLTSVDVDGGLVEFLQLPLEVIQQQRDEAKRRRE